MGQGRKAAVRSAGSREAQEANPVPVLQRGGVLLYIGITVSIVSRTYQHMINEPWFVQVVDVKLQHLSPMLNSYARSRSQLATPNPGHAADLKSICGPAKLVQALAGLVFDRAA